jgi:AraC family transcriptional regulator
LDGDFSKKFTLPLLPKLKSWRKEIMPQGNTSTEVLAQTKTSDGLGIQLRKDPRGVLDIPALANVIVGVHLGAPTRVGCSRDGKRFIGTAIHGDIDIIAAGTPSRWEIYDDNDTGLFISVPQEWIRAIAVESGMDPARIEIRNRFQTKDHELQSIAWAMRKELEQGCPSGRLYLGGLSVALASRLLVMHSSLTRGHSQPSEGLDGRRLRQVLTFIEEHLEQDISLEQIAGQIQISASHLKALFRKSLGLPVYQYVLRRRVERAKQLLTKSTLSTAEIALATGFAHQSHMARQMRRHLGASPGEVRRTSKGKAVSE